MSQYVVFEVEAFKHKECLVEAGRKLGFTVEVAQPGETLTARNYWGNQLTGEIIFRREYLTPNASDIAFSWDEQQGGYVARIDHYDKEFREQLPNGHNKFKVALKIAYHEAVFAREAQAQQARLQRAIRSYTNEAGRTITVNGYTSWR